MKKLLLLSSLFIFTFSYSQNAPKTYIDSVSYSIGVDLAKNIERIDKSLNPEFLSEGILHGLKKAGYLIPQDQCEIVSRAYITKLQQEQQEAQQKQEAAANAIHEKNLIEGKEFLEKNKLNKDIVVTESGLQYKIIKKGKGDKPTTNDQVTLHYKGTLINGEKFDSSYDRGEPTTFGVTQVIPGFSEAIQLMSPGAHYIVYIPQDLAYGNRNAGKIKPYSTLIFEIELISIPTQKEEE